MNIIIINKQLLLQTHTYNGTKAQRYNNNNIYSNTLSHTIQSKNIIHTQCLYVHTKGMCL